MYRNTFLYPKKTWPCFSLRYFVVCNFYLSFIIEVLERAEAVLHLLSSRTIASSQSWLCSASLQYPSCCPSPFEARPLSDVHNTVHTCIFSHLQLSEAWTPLFNSKHRESPHSFLVILLCAFPQLSQGTHFPSWCSLFSLWESLTKSCFPSLMSCSSSRL